MIIYFNLKIWIINIYFCLVKKSNKKRKATSTPHLSVKNDSDRKRHRKTIKNKSSGNIYL